MTKVFVFDIGNVLSTFDSSALIRSFFSDPASQDQIHRILFPELWNRYDQGLVSEDEMIETAAALMPEKRIKIEQMMKSWARQLKVHQKNLELVRSIVQDCYILSNLPEQAELELARQGLFDSIKDYAASWRLKLVKPDPAIYQAFLDKTGLNAADCIFIDDHIENVEAARHAGMQGIHLRSIDDLENVLVQNGAIFASGSQPVISSQ